MSAVLNQYQPVPVSNVISILGHPYAPPVLLDRRGRKVVFQARMADGSCVSAEGDEAPYGLVLHRTITCMDAKGAPRRPFYKWTVSEPTTGARVAAGVTRAAALQALAERVAHHGDEKAFTEVLADCVRQVLAQTPLTLVANESGT